MNRIADVFVTVCIVVVAVSVGAIVLLQTSMGPAAALAATLGILLVLMLYHAHALRLRDRRLIETQLDDLARRTSISLGEVGALDRRLGAVENGQQAAKVDPGPLAQEVEVLSTLVKHVAETVAGLDDRLGSTESRLARTEDLASRALAPRPAERPVPPAPAVELAAAPSRRQAEPPAAPRLTPITVSPALAERVRKALLSDAVEMLLQPIVTLPQRRVRFYAAAARLRDPAGQPIEAGPVLSAAGMAGLAGEHDRRIVDRAATIFRRLATKGGDVAVFVGVSAGALAEGGLVRMLSARAEADPALAAGLVLSLPQAVHAALDPIEAGALGELVRLGFRVALTDVDDLRLDPRSLADGGVRFVTVAARRLLSAAPSEAGDIHPADLPALLARSGIEPIAGEVETEAQVLEILDTRFALADGPLFGAARPVRAEVFAEPTPAPAATPQAATARPPVAARQAPPPAAPTRPVGAQPRGTSSGIGALAARIAAGPTVGARPIPPPSPPPAARPEAPVARSAPPAPAGEPASPLGEVLRRVDPRLAGTRRLGGG